MNFQTDIAVGNKLYQFLPVLHHTESYTKNNIDSYIIYDYYHGLLLILPLFITCVKSLLKLFRYSSWNIKQKCIQGWFILCYDDDVQSHE